jgi:N-acetylmuramic acid 6-phosphate etherase
MARSLDDSRSAEESALDELTTEAGSDPSAGYELRSTVDLVELMSDEDAIVSAAVRAASKPIAGVIDAAAAALERGGRLVYVGAGSSGRIAALDALECESTFSTPPGKVVALIAGGSHASALDQEAAEDDRDAARLDSARLGIEPDDVVVGVSASGRTPYVLAALEAASAVGSTTACVVSAPDSELERAVDHPIVVIVGPEFLAGSTRLKAGTAQKLVLNMISTISMIRLGKTLGNLMVDVAATNEKLRARVRRIVRAATDAAPEDVEAALEAADGNAKVAIVSLLAEVDAAEARRRLENASHSIRSALGR